MAPLIQDAIRDVEHAQEPSIPREMTKILSTTSRDVGLSRYSSAVALSTILILISWLGLDRMIHLTRKIGRSQDDGL